MAQQELEKRLKTLEDSVRTIQDMEEIKQLQKIYGYYLEHWQGEQIIDLFSDAPDTSVELFKGVYLGKDGVKRCFSGRKVPPEELHALMQLSGVVDVDPGGKTAKGRWYGFGCLAVPRDGVIRATFESGIYENEYVKEGGKWKFKKLHWNRTFGTPYEDGWVKTPVLEPPKPDRINTAYPSGYIVPYHYKHPITGK